MRQFRAVRRWLQRVNFAPVSSTRCKGQHAPRCYYSFTILLSSRLQNITLKHIWSFKGSVNIDGKIWKEFTCSLFRTSHSQIFCMLLHREKVPRLYVIAENTTYRRQYFAVTLYHWQISARWNCTLLLDISFSWGTRVCEKNNVQNNDRMLLGRINRVQNPLPFLNSLPFRDVLVISFPSSHTCQTPNSLSKQILIDRNTKMGI